MTVKQHSYFFPSAPTAHYLLHNTCLHSQTEEWGVEYSNKRSEIEEQRWGGGDFRKEKGEKKNIFAVPITFKQLSSGPQTRITKAEDARPLRMVDL